MRTDHVIRRQLEGAGLDVPLDDEDRLAAAKRGFSLRRNPNRPATIAVAAMIAAVGLAVAWQLLPRAADEPGTLVMGPDGTVALWVSPGGFEDFSTMQLAVSDGELTALVDGQTAMFPQWSPDGSALAFAALEGEWLQLIVDVGGERTVVLSKGVHDFSWAPDGAFLWAVVSAEAVGSGGGDLIVRVGLDGSLEVVTAIERGNWQSVSPSPDGSRLVLTGDGGASSADGRAEQSVWVVNTDGSGMQEISSDRETYAFWARWSPDGSRIVFVRGPSFDDFDPASDLYSVRPNGADLTRLTDHAGFDGWPVWSPDGRWILFSSDRAASHEQQVRNRQDPSAFGGAGAFMIPAEGGQVQDVLLPVDDRQLVFTSGWRTDPR